MSAPAAVAFTLPGAAAARLRASALFDGVALLCRWIAAAALVGDLVLICVAVLWREVLHLPVLWADEVARILLVVLVFFGAAAALAQGQHMGIQALAQRLSGPMQAAVRAGTEWVILGVAVSLCLFGAAYSAIVWDQIT